MLPDSEIVVLKGNDTYAVLKVCACLACEYVGDNLICGWYFYRVLFGRIMADEQLIVVLCL